MYFLFLLSIKAILSSVIGSSFYSWFKDTNLGIWVQKKVDSVMDHIFEKEVEEIEKKDSKFRQQYPLQADRLDALEEDFALIWEIHSKEIIKYLNKKK